MLDAQDSKFMVTLLGTAGGPPPSPERAGISTAVVVEGVSYVVDCGRSAVTQYQRAGLEYAKLDNIFITHLHADHLADYYNFFLLASTTASTGGDRLPSSVGVFGPGSAQDLPPVYGDWPAPTVAPECSTPGTVDMTNRCHEAFAYSSNIYNREWGFEDPRDVADVHEIVLPSGIRASALGERAPAMEPFTVMEDDRVRVSAVLVPHGPVFPAFAFRFDSDYGSVTFSGDTRRSDNLIRLARSSDLLIHEAIRVPKEHTIPEPVLKHVLETHVQVEEVGSIAQEAEVPKLVLSHTVDLGGPIDPAEWKQLAQEGYDGIVDVGLDLNQYMVG